MRPDIVVRYMVIKQYKNYDDPSVNYGQVDAYDLYKRLFAAWGGQNGDELLVQFKTLIDSIETEGFRSDSLLIFDSNMTPHDGGHRLACALFFRIREVNIAKLKFRKDVNGLDYPWFENNGFGEEEILSIRNTSDSIIQNIVQSDKRVGGVPDKRLVIDYIHKQIKRVLEYDQLALNGKSVAHSTNRDFELFYQSLPMLGIKGERPTDVRIREYGLLQIVKQDSYVLDIGCNLGFIDLEISKFVRGVTGVEFNPEACELSKKTAEMLGIRNTTFESGDFKDWIKYSHRKYDFIMAFEIHEWLGMPPGEFAETIDRLTTNYGGIILESHSLSSNEKKFNCFIEALHKQGFKTEREGIINDTGDCERRWVYMEKVRFCNNE
jgi:SAM-dependent methyltransferase